MHSRPQPASPGLLTATAPAALVAAASPVAADASSQTPAAGSRRRRIWELPAAAHEPLLGLSLHPDQLRSAVASAIGRHHGVRCGITGSDVTLLFSTLHDLAERNAVSEALHRLFDARHAQPLRQWAGTRDLAALRQAWADALAAPQHNQVPALLWVLLTHPCGPVLQDDLLRELRCWLYGRTRVELALATRTEVWQQRCEALNAELSKARAAHQRASADAAARALADAQALARLRGELARLSDATVSAVAPPPASVPNAAARAPRLRAPRPAPPVEAAATHRDVQTAPPSSLPIAGRNVLCVGGINHAVHRYRALVEARGGHFQHHDGGIEHSLHRLSTQLAGADLVLCQAACVNHEAYRCVKTHCKRAGIACIYLDRPSLSRFARELGMSPT